MYCIDSNSKLSIEVQKQSEKMLKDEIITIRLTELEKKLIERNAQKRNKSVSRFVVEAAVFSEPMIIRTIRPVMVEVRKLSEAVRSLERTVRDGGQWAPSLDDIIDLQKNIFSMVQSMAARGES